MQLFTPPPLLTHAILLCITPRSGQISHRSTHKRSLPIAEHGVLCVFPLLTWVRLICMQTHSGASSAPSVVHPKATLILQFHIWYTWTHLTTKHKSVIKEMHLKSWLYHLSRTFQMFFMCPLLFLSFSLLLLSFSSLGCQQEGPLLWAWFCSRFFPVKAAPPPRSASYHVIVMLSTLRAVLVCQGSSADAAVTISQWFCAADAGVRCKHEWAEHGPGALQYSPVQWRRCDCQSDPLVVC